MVLLDRLVFSYANFIKKKLFILPAIDVKSQIVSKKYQKIINHFKKCDREIEKFMSEELFNRYLPPEKHKTDEQYYFDQLCRTIAGQQLSGKAADTIYARFVNLLGRMKINPTNILKLADQDIRNVGFSWAKVSYIKDLATKTKTKVLHLEKLTSMNDDDIKNELVSVKGLGPWSAEMFLIFTLRRENIFSFGDLGLLNGIKKVYHLTNPSQKQIEKIIAKWEPYKTYGAIALWKSLEK